MFLGIPLCWIEWTIGRRGGIYGGHSCASIFLNITHSHLWKYLGIFGVVAPLGIGMYYMYLEGWTLGYTYHMAVGDLNLENSEQFFAMPLTQAEKLVPAGMFRRCHISYLVNLSWVRHASHTGVVLTNGQRLPMSRTFYSEFQRAVVHRLNI